MVLRVIYIILFSFLLLNAKENIFLNAKERMWLYNLKKPITIGITEIPNQVLITKNGYKGFSIDLFSIIEKKLHIKFKYVYFNTWKEVLKAAKNKKIDIVFLAQKTPSRLSYLDYTDTVLTQQNKIIVNINNDRYKTIEQLKNKRVAVTQGSAIEEYLSYNYPEIKLLLTKNELESLRLLNQGKVDASISEAVRASYYIKKYNLNNLLISNNLGYDYYLSIATVSNDRILNVILGKVISNSIKQIKALQLKWGYVKDKIVFFDKKTIFFIFTVFIIIMGFLIYFYNINKKLQIEIKEKEEALERLKILRNSRLNQMSEVISMIAHQWKQPLNTLSMLNQIIIMKYKKRELDFETMQNFEKHSKEQIDLMVQTIDDFKEFFKIEEKIQKFNVQNIIQDSIKIVKPIFDKNKIKINYYHFNSYYFTLGYPNALKQIIINILNNAKDILIEKNIVNKIVNIDIKEENEFIIIEIEDNAGGIPIEIIDKIFNPYFSTKKEGTGLGLYMSKIIIEEKMKGIIEVYNTKNGANFEIKLPIFKG